MSLRPLTLLSTLLHPFSNTGISLITLLQEKARAVWIMMAPTVILYSFSSLFTGQVGIALNGEWYQPQTNSTEDKAAAELGMQFVVSN